MRWSQAELDAWQAKRFAGHSMDDLVDSFAPDQGPESRLQGKIEAWCKEWGRPCLSLRQSKAAKRLLLPGWPDCSIAMPGGKTLWLELKAAKGVLSKEQKQIRLQFMALGHEIYVVKSFKRFLSLISGYQNGLNVDPGGK